MFLAFNQLKAQTDGNNDSTQQYGFDKHKLFAGGSLNLGYSGGYASSFVVGVLPEIGYSFKSWLDVGLAFNFNYYSGSEYHDQYNSNNSTPGYNATIYGAGAFVRVHPFEGYFIQFQPEVDQKNLKYTYDGVSGKEYRTSASYLVGIGWGTRVVGENSFYTTLMIDLGNEKNTPYKDVFGNILPVIRAGFNFYF